MTAPSGSRFTLRDLPAPAKLVVTAFLISVGLGYVWAMAQIHFKHSTMGNALPTSADLVSRFSGVPWPLEPKPEGWPTRKAEEAPKVDLASFKKPGIRIKTIITDRCVRCHKKDGGEKSDAPLETFQEVKKFATPNRGHKLGKLHDLLMGAREEWSDNMVDAFFEKSADWDRLTPEQKKAEEPRRESERKALLAWVDAKAPQDAYDKDRFPLPANIKIESVPPKLLVEMDSSVAAAATGPKEAVKKEKTAFDRWDEAHARQLNIEHLTQSTHAHLLTFSILWALTGLCFAFTHYSSFVRCILSPVVLIAQVADVACWWLRAWTESDHTSRWPSWAPAPWSDWVWSHRLG